MSYGAGTLRPIPTEPLCIPDLCLAGRLPQQHNAVFNLDLSAANAVPGAAADVTAWPEFHNGVAAGTLWLLDHFLMLLDAVSCLCLDLFPLTVLQGELKRHGQRSTAFVL